MGSHRKVFRLPVVHTSSMIIRVAAYMKFLQTNLFPLDKICLVCTVKILAKLEKIVLMCHIFVDPRTNDSFENI